MMIMHVYRKFVIFNIYIYTWFEGYYIFFKSAIGGSLQQRVHFKDMVQ